MARKRDILKKIRILLSQNFDTPHDAFQFFDKNQSGTLNRLELKNMLKAAEISGFLTGLVARRLITDLDQDGDGEVSWQEFRVEVKKLMKSNLE